MNEVVKKKNLKERKETLKKKMAELIIVDENQLKVSKSSRAYVYIYDLKHDYKKEDFNFLPGEFMLDQNSHLSICLGAGRSPNIESPHALWFLSEKMDQINFFDTQHIKEGLKKKFIPVNS